MKAKYLVGAVVMVVVLIGGYMAVSGKTSASQSNNTPSAQSSTAATTGSEVAKQLFQSSSDAQFSYQIFPGTVSAQAKTAMAGFALTTQSMTDGATQVMLSAQNPGYQTQVFTLKTGEKLYFIERMGGDDHAAQDTDTNLGDDKGVVVDASGYIVPSV